MRAFCRLTIPTIFLGAALVSTSCTNGDTPAPVTPGTTTGEGMTIEFRSQSDPPKFGDNTFEVTVRKDGAPVSDATVTAEFSMPPMPSMNMPEMHSTLALESQGDGRYRGAGQLSMAGTWNVVVKVSHGTEVLGSHRLSIIAK